MAYGCTLPVVAWPLGATGATTDVDIKIAGVTETKTINLDAFWGWGVTSSSGAAATWSAAYALASAINSHSNYATCTATYDLITSLDTGNPPTYVLRPTAQVTVTFASTAIANLFGFVTDVILPANTNTRTDYGVGACWAPNGASGRVDVQTRQRAAASSSIMAPAVTDVVGWGAISAVRLYVVQAKSANVILDYAQNPIYAAQANRDITDPNNTLEGLLAGVAQTGVAQTLRISRDYDGTYISAALPGVASLPGALDHLSWSDEPRLCSGTVQFVGVA